MRETTLILRLDILSSLSDLAPSIGWLNFLDKSVTKKGNDRVKAWLLIAAYKELISERPSFELCEASENLRRPISCAKIDSGSIGDIYFCIRPLHLVEICL